MNNAVFQYMVLAFLAGISSNTTNSPSGSLIDSLASIAFFAAAIYKAWE